MKTDYQITVIHHSLQKSLYFLITKQKQIYYQQRIGT